MTDQELAQIEELDPKDVILDEEDEIFILIRGLIEDFESRQRTGTDG